MLARLWLLRRRGMRRQRKRRPADFSSSVSIRRALMPTMMPMARSFHHLVSLCPRRRRHAATARRVPVQTACSRIHRLVHAAVCPAATAMDARDLTATLRIRAMDLRSLRRNVCKRLPKTCLIVSASSLARCRRPVRRRLCHDTICSFRSYMHIVMTTMSIYIT